MSEPSGPADFVRDISARFCATGKLLDSWQRETEVLESSSCTNARDHDGTRSVLQLVAIANKRTDRVYLVVFQSTDGTWEEEWEAVGETMMETFVLDDEF